MESFSIGMRIRALRIAQKRTIQEIASLCSLSKSMVSKIETNNVVPSVATLVKLAKALGTNVSVLLEENDSQTSVVIKGQKAIGNLTKTEKGYHIFPFASEYKDKKMQPFLFVANKGEVIEHRLSHDGEEFINVIDGEMRVHIGGNDFTLEKGDSVYFNALEKHGIMPITDTVKYINIFV